MAEAFAAFTNFFSWNFFHEKAPNVFVEMAGPLKKYDFGYAILTFGVGDCPIGLLNKDLTEND